MSLVSSQTHGMCVRAMLFLARINIGPHMQPMALSLSLSLNPSSKIYCDWYTHRMCQCTACVYPVLPVCIYAMSIYFLTQSTAFYYSTFDKYKKKNVKLLLNRVIIMVHTEVHANRRHGVSRWLFLDDATNIRIHVKSCLVFLSNYRDNKMIYTRR